MIFPSKVISIDPSLRSTGVYVGGRLYTIAKAADKTHDNTDETLENILFDIRAFVVGHGPKICLLEDYSFASSGNAVTTIAEVKGIIKSVMFDYGVPIITVNIGLWKSVAGFKMPKKGAGWKREYLVEAQRLTGKVFETPDEVDAFMIFRAVSRIVEKGGHTEAQKKIYKQAIDILRRSL